MKQLGDMKLYSLQEVTDEFVGKKGTPERDTFDREVGEALDAYRMGEAIKHARIENKLTQQELGERVGVKKSQISKLEKGKSVITLPTMSRVFKALGVTSATLDLGKAGRVALW